MLWYSVYNFVHGDIFIALESSKITKSIEGSLSHILYYKVFTADIVSLH